MQKILLVGGTFCPPHRAHLELANTVQKKYHFDQVIFVPCKAPVLDKTSHASIEDRIAMLQLAIQPYPHFSMDLCEINRTTPSYMITTLTYFRHRYGQDISLTLLIGMDNFLQLPRWHQWETILERCHLLVVERPSVKVVFDETIEKILTEHKFTDDKNLCNSPYGTVKLMNAGHFNISSTHIRSTIKQKIEAGENTDELIDPAVRAYIKTHHLF